MSKPTQPTWLPIKEIAARLNVHPATVRRLAKRKSVPVARLGGAHRIREDHVPMLMEMKVG
ncbi:MAG: helix-turn-helix domain-containing protein [Tagaea sp.]|nr:helix-turn-helix domain-containing protein [Tagaea sp.]